jgi:hypothetical protein
MKTVISLILFLASLFLCYLLFLNIQEPIKFQAELENRESSVIKKLEVIRKAQEFYKDITGKYAGSFDSLKYVLETDSFSIIKIEGDPDDPNGKFIRSIIKKSAIDSIRTLEMDISDLASIPYSDNAKFDIQADTLTYQSTLVNVTEVGTRYKQFMGPFASRKYSKFDNSYDPDARIKFGDMNSPNLSGNW